jgi:antitoxin MazE
MISRVQKWGNSLALRIPGAFAKEIGLKNATLVELSQVEGKLIITPLAEPDITLDTLLASINKDNIHGEVDSGYATGNEIW